MSTAAPVPGTCVTERGKSLLSEISTSVLNTQVQKNTLTDNCISYFFLRICNKPQDIFSKNA